MTLTDYAQPFSDAEIPAANHTIHDVERLKKQHERCMELLDAIRSFQVRKQLKREHIEGFAGTFPALRARYVNDIDTLNRCISKFEAMYYAEVSKMMKK